MRKLGLALFLSLWALGPLGLAPAQAQSTNCIVPASLAATPVISAVAESGHVLKAAPGCLISVYATIGATGGFLMVFNSITVPVDGAVAPQDCIQVAASTSNFLNWAPQPPEFFSVGVSIAFSTTGCFTKTASATAFFHAIVQ